MVARVAFQVVGTFAFPTIRTVILIVKLFAGTFDRLRAENLSADMVREVAVHSILAVTGEVMDAGILIAFHMDSSILALRLALLFSAFVNGEVLVRAHLLDQIQLLFQLLVLYEILVVHSTLLIYYIRSFYFLISTLAQPIILALLCILSSYNKGKGPYFY